MNDTGRETAEALYEAGKQGRRDQVARAFAADGALAGAAVRYRKPSSGWTLLHQAAFWRNRDAARLCLHYGAVLDAEAKGKETPAEVAVARSDAAMAAWLRRAVVGGLWRPVEDPALRASSNLCSSLAVDAGRRIAAEDFLVAYAGSPVAIRTGDRYQVDAWERVLVGWHGTFDPPCGMDGEPLL